MPPLWGAHVPAQRGSDSEVGYQTGWARLSICSRCLCRSSKSPHGLSYVSLEAGTTSQTWKPQVSGHRSLCDAGIGATFGKTEFTVEYIQSAARAHPLATPSTVPYFSFFIAALWTFDLVYIYFFVDPFWCLGF